MYCKFMCGCGGGGGTLKIHSKFLIPPAGVCNCEGTVLRIKYTLKETQRISAHKYRIVQGGEYSTPTLNMRKYRSLKKTLTLKCKYLTLYKPCTQRNPTKLDSIFFKMFLLIF